MMVVQVRALPMPARELVMRLAERNQPPSKASRNCSGEAVPRAVCVASDCTVASVFFYAMIKFIDQKLLPLFSLLAVGDVLHDTHAVEKVTTGVAHRRRPHRNPDHPAVPANEALFQGIETDVASDLPAIEILVDVTIARIGACVESRSQQLFAAQTGDRAYRFVDPQKPALGIDLHNADRRMLVGGVPALALFAQVLLAAVRAPGPCVCAR